MATFLLIHGAWHGGWCWKKVTPLLREASHQVFTPTLTGLGERSHLAHPLIGLETHVRDVAQVLTYEDLSEVILVGHSSAGTLITAVAERVPERLAHLVYLDGFVPQDGQSTMDLINFLREPWEARVRTEGREAIGAWLDEHGIADEKARALLVVVAAGWPVDATNEDTLSWLTFDEHGQPLDGTLPLLPCLPVPADDDDCGTYARYLRHRRAGYSKQTVEACGCLQAARDHWNARNARRREAAREQSDAA